MKAKLRAIVFLAAGILLCGGLLTWLLLPPAASVSTEAAATVYEVVNVPLTDLEAVKVENAQASFAVLNAPQGAEMVSESTGTYDESQLRALLYAAGHISGSRKVSDPKTFDGYGFSKPRATVTLYLADQTRKRFQVLMDNPAGQSTYLYAEDEQAIYLIPQEIAALFLRTEKDFLNHTVFPLSTQEDFDKIRQISLYYQSGGRDYTLEQTDQGFFLTAPVHLRLARAEVLNNLLYPLMQLYADEVVATNANLADYGLAQPELEISLTLDTKTIHAVLARTEGNRCYLAEKGGSVVYRLDDAPMLMLLQDYTALLGSGIVRYAAGDITDITLTDQGASLFVPFSSDETAPTAKVGSVSIPAEVQAQLMQALNQLTPVAELNESVTNEPVFQWTANLRSGVRETVALIGITEDVYAVAINGEATFATDAAALQRLHAVWDSLNALE